LYIILINDIFFSLYFVEGISWRNGQMNEICPLLIGFDGIFLCLVRHWRRWCRRRLGFWVSERNRIYIIWICFWGIFFFISYSWIMIIWEKVRQFIFFFIIYRWYFIVMVILSWNFIQVVMWGYWDFIRFYWVGKLERLLFCVIILLVRVIVLFIWFLKSNRLFFWKIFIIIDFFNLAILRYLVIFILFIYFIIFIIFIYFIIFIIFTCFFIK
jgi:hypothetical protein